MAQLARYLAGPAEHHMRAAKRVFAYLNGTRSYALTFRAGQRLQLVGYADASYASDPIDRRSTSGLLFMLGGAAVAWRSKKQTLVTTSTTEAEYVALFHATQQVVPLLALLRFLGVAIEAGARTFVRGQHRCATAGV